MGARELEGTRRRSRRLALDTPTVPIGVCVEEAGRSALEQRRYQPSRPWSSPSRYSLLMGRGEVLNADGSVDRVVDEDWCPNALTNVGQSELINVFLRGTAQSAGYYLGLTVVSTATTALPTLGTDSSKLTQTALAGAGLVTEEDTTKGYARQQILQAAWGAPSIISVDEQTTAAQKTFGPATTTAWTGTTTQPAQIAYAILISTASGATGTWVLFFALSGATSIQLTQSFAYTLTLKVT